MELKLSDRRMLADIEAKLHEYSLQELETWRRHVHEHPYQSSDISESIIRMLNKEIMKRKQ